MKDDFSKSPYFVKVADLDIIKLKNILDLGYTHITQSTFVGNRRISNLAFSNYSMVIDLDFYKIKEYEKLTPAEMLEVLKQDPIFNELKPSIVYSSGNGVNLVFLLKSNLALYNKQNNHQLRRILYQNIAKRFEKYGADKQTTDITRFNKIPGVYNYKNGKQVKVLEYLNTEYNINELIDTLKVEKVSKNTKKTKKTSKINYLLNPYSLKYARFNDITTLIELRNFDIESRENTLFLIGNYHYQAFQNKEDTENYLLSINRRLKNPLSERELLSTIKRLNGKYNHKNSTLIETLNITLEEQRYMNTIISREEKNRRERERYRRNNPIENNKKLISKLEKKGKVEIYYKAGMKPKEIIEKTGYSKATVFNLLKEIKEGLNSK